MANGLGAVYEKLKDHPQYLESIVSISYLPSECVDTSMLTLEHAGGLKLNVVNNFRKQIKRTVLSVDKYASYPQVTESKLLMYPYSYIEVTAYTGETLDLKLENIKGSKIEIESWGYLNTNGRLAFVVKNYNGDTSLDNALIVSDFPLLPTASSSYDMYLAQNKTQLGMNLLTGGLAVAGGLATGNLLATGYGVQNISGTLAKQNDLQVQPNAINTQKGGNGFNIANNLKGVTVKKKMIKPEYRQILTEYWKAYGYKVNRIKTPNIKTRQHFNFIKTIGCNITGDIPQDDLKKLKSIFDNGCTFWHGDYVGDYSKENNEV